MYETSINEISQIVIQEISPKQKFKLVKYIVNDVEYVERYNLFATIYNNRNLFLYMRILIIGKNGFIAKSLFNLLKINISTYKIDRRQPDSGPSDSGSLSSRRSADVPSFCSKSALASSKPPSCKTFESKFFFELI